VLVKPKQSVPFGGGRKDLRVGGGLRGSARSRGGEGGKKENLKKRVEVGYLIERKKKKGIAGGMGKT